MKFLKIFLPVLIFSSIIDTCIAQKKATEYDAAKYFAYTNKAELQIVDANYKNALLFYDSAFLNLSIPLTQDMYNYSICAVLEKKYKVTYRALQFLIERGCDTSIFFKNSAFYDFKIREQKKIKKKYPIFISNRTKYIDSTIIKDIQQMNTIDQFFFRRLPNNQSNKNFKDSLEKNDDSIATRLKQYFTLFQYLHEGVVGVSMNDSQLTCYPIFFVLIRHHYQNRKYDLTPALKKALELGLLKPELYSLWVDFEFQNKPGFASEGIINETRDSLFVKTFSGISSKIAENRMKIGLCTLEEQIKKTSFSRYCDKNGFLFFNDVVKLSESNKAYIDILRKFAIVKQIPCKGD